MIKFRDLNRLSFRYKLIFIIFIIVVLPFLFIGYFSYMKSVESIESTNSYLSLDLLKQTGKHVDQFVDFINETQNEVMGSEKLQTLLDENPKTQMEQISFVNQLYTLTSQYNKTPDLYTIRIYPIEPSKYSAYMHSVFKSKDVEKEVWFQRSKTAGSPFWQLFPAEEYPGIYDQTSVSKVKRLRSLQDYRFTAIVVIDVTEKALANYIEQLQRVRGQQLMLLDERNTIIFHTDRNKIGSISQSGMMNDVVGYSKQGTRIVEIDGVRNLVAYTTLDTSKWKLVSLIPVVELIKPVSGIQNFTVIFTILYFMLSIGVLVYITLKFTSPIHTLVSNMRKVEMGDFNVHLKVGGRQDEVGWLYKGFNRMITQIRLLIEEVQKSGQAKKELEFQVLTHQINPHFLYNTLESIRWKAEQLHAEDISDMVTSLGSLMRLSLNNGKEMTTVRRELEHVRQYVNIVSARQYAPVRITFFVDEDLLDLPFLRLLLQPLVENAIQHGANKDPEKGKIFVKGGKIDGNICFEIIDNGPGIPEDDLELLLIPLEPLKKQTDGVGLKNVHERLRLYFGEEYGLRIHSSDKGTAVELIHPILSYTDVDHAENERR